MRVLVVGGTRFIGRALVEELLAHDHEVMVLHRGRHEPDGLPDVPHLHADRRDLAPHRAAVAGFNADAVADIWANSGAETEAFLRALPGDPRLVMTSSVDVYRVRLAARRRGHRPAAFGRGRAAARRAGGGAGRRRPRGVGVRPGRL